MRKPRDLADLERRLLAIPKRVRQSVQPAIDKGADELVNRMRFLSPDETGDLDRSIEAKPGPVPLSAIVSAGGRTTTDAKGFDYALGVEYGTQSMPASPYFWVSVRTAGPRVRRRIDRAIGKAIREVWK